MKKWITCVVLLVSLLCNGAEASAQDWVDVKDYGAVGDAAYHHHLSRQRSEWGYWAGHYASLVTATYYVPCEGEGRSAQTLTVIADGRSKGAGQICLSEVRSGLTSYEPAVGDEVAPYTAVDQSASVPATDDSAAFEQAIAAGDGRLYLPEGDYMVSQLTAAKIKGLKGPGKIWLKEWLGGSVYYLTAGISSKELAYQNYGWTDEAHFSDSAWRDMHWVTCLGEVNGWTDSSEFAGNVSARMEFPFHSTRDNLNAWVTVQPAVAEEDFPDSVTICIANVSANYTLKGSKKWRLAGGTDIDGSLYSLAWDGTRDDIPTKAWKDCGDRVEITLRREDFFRTSDSGEAETWTLHCWTTDNKSLKKQRVEYVCNTARVWVKEKSARGCLMCDIGGDMRTTWEDRNVPEGYIMEACDSGTYLLTTTPRRLYSYTLPDEQFDSYKPFPR